MKQNYQIFLLAVFTYIYPLIIVKLIKTFLLYIMAALYIAAGVNHFRKPDFYLKIMPGYFPAPHLLNQLSGVAEIVLGLLLLFKTTRSFAACGIAIMLLSFFTVHINMLQQSYQIPGYFMPPLMGWFRIALQFVLIAWALWYRKQMQQKDSPY